MRKIYMLFLWMLLVFMFSCSSPVQVAMNTNDQDGIQDVSNQEIDGVSRSITNYPTGGILTTEKEIADFREQGKLVKKVRLNDLALERVNKARSQKGKSRIYLSTVDEGEELLCGAEPVETDSVLVEALENVDYVDNSVTDYFPEVGNQDSTGSCSAWAATYYTGTYMWAWANGQDVSSNQSLALSPKFTYNFLNEGDSTAATSINEHNSILLKHGAANFDDFPFDDNCSDWPIDGSVYASAIERRAEETGLLDVTTEEGVDSLKQMLLDGYVVPFATTVYSWVYTTILDNPDTSSDDAFTGQLICSHLEGSDGAHSMTIVGYNDDVWCDLNENGTVDTGESGAFKVVNSWGTDYGNSGYMWLAYDSINLTSSVTDGPNPSDRTRSLNSVYWITFKSNYEPRMICEFTLNHAKRNQIYLRVGISHSTAVSPVMYWIPYIFRGQGGDLAFDGGTSAIDGTFAIDLTDIIEDYSDWDEERYYLIYQDSASGDSLSVNSYKVTSIEDGGIDSEYLGTLPVEIDYDSANIYVDYPPGQATPTPVPVNLALNQSVYASTYESALLYLPENAVDGDVSTLWRTEKNVKNRSNEWIYVDLGAEYNISKVILEWSTYYATEYSIQGSTDGSSWTAVASVSNGTGGDEEISFTSVTARYVRMYSTAWTSSREGCWLKEFEVY